MHTAVGERARSQLTPNARSSLLPNPLSNLPRRVWPLREHFTAACERLSSMGRRPHVTGACQVAQSPCDGIVQRCASRPYLELLGSELHLAHDLHGRLPPLQLLLRLFLL